MQDGRNEPAPAGSYSPVGFVGAGSMGAPMVERLLAAGVPVHLFARRASVRERFAALGATIAPSLGAVAEATRVVILCPFSADQLEEVVTGPDGLLNRLYPGSVLVAHATVPVDAVETLAAATAERGVTLLDAPISGTSEAILAGRLTVLVGGDATAADQAERLVRTYASTIVRTGPAGSATKVKLINNLMFAAQVQVAVAAVGLGEQLGVRAPDLLAALGACSAGSVACGHLQAAGNVDSFVQGVGPYLRKDVAAIEQTLTAMGLDAGPLGEVVRNGPASLLPVRADS